MAIAERPPTTAFATDDIEGLLVVDLLSDFAGLRRMLVAEARRGAWTDVFLLAAGMNQVLEDHLSRDVGELRKVAQALRPLSPAGPLAYSAILGLRGLLLGLRAMGPDHRRLARGQAQLAALVDELAAQLINKEERDSRRLAAAAIAVAERLGRVPRSLDRAVIRLPSCFRSLDQQPADCARLAERFAGGRPDRSRPLAVVGVRTSGSYLAPLTAACLRLHGFAAVEVLTMRPGRGLGRRESRVLARIAQLGGRALLCDDPPETGAALAAAAAAVQSAGRWAEPAVLLICLLAGRPVPERLHGHECIVLEPEEWEIERQLSSGCAVDVLQGLLAGRELETDAGRVRVAKVEAVEQIAIPPDPDAITGRAARRHVRTVYRVDVRATGSGRVSSLRVYAKGAGFGYFGRHALAVGGGLADFLPEQFGFAGGLLYRRWLPESSRLPGAALDPRSFGRRVGAYVRERSLAFPVADDISPRLAGRQPVWQRVADLLGRSFGRSRIVARPGLHRAAIRLFATPRPSVIDGSMAVHQWFNDGRGRLRKVDYEERAFSNEDLTCYDAAYDLAGAAADAQTKMPSEIANVAVSEMRAEFEAGLQPIDGERWLLYRLQHLDGLARDLREAWSGERPKGSDARLAAALDAAQSAQEHAYREYLGNLLLDGIDGRGSGRLSAIDLDGVLETADLGFSGATPAGIMALRALLAHGRRPVIASGRSLVEVVDRCRDFGLEGGVAEYGSVAYEAGSEFVKELVDPAGRSVLADLRRALLASPGVLLDSRYTRVVRAYRFDAAARRRGLPPDLVTSLVREHPGVRAVPGWAQTDFVAASVDKATGFGALADLLGEPRMEPGFAIGDTAADLPLLRVSRHAYAPANADTAILAAGVRIMRSRFQAGLAQAVAIEIGHRPGVCHVCAPPRLGPRPRLLLLALSAQDQRRWGRLRTAARLRMAT
jgi:hydroxymethylpyrimidine pyrophosphatase-like HAD family hydrolase